MNTSTNKTISNIVFLLESPLTKRDKSRFGFDILIRNGFNVFYWDLTKILFPNWLNNVDIYQQVNDNLVVKFSSISEVIERIKLIKMPYFISMIGYNLETNLIFRHLVKNKIPYSFIIDSHVFNENRSFIKRLKYMTYKKLLLGLSLRFNNYLSYLFSYPADMVMIRGSNINLKDIRINSSTTKLWLHSWDYDLFLSENHQQIDVANNYAIFIDDYFPFHPDPIRYNVTSHEDSFEYYTELCHFFEYVEKSQEVEIIIAAHPRSNPEMERDYYKGREIYINKTNELVKNAKFVITSASTAVSFAVMYNKPIIFIITDRLLKTKFAFEIPKFSKYFGKTPINISKDLNGLELSKELHVEKKLYDKYFIDFIKSPYGEEKLYWQSVAEYISNYNIN